MHFRSFLLSRSLPGHLFPCLLSRVLLRRFIHGISVPAEIDGLRRSPSRGLVQTADLFGGFAEHPSTVRAVSGVGNAHGVFGPRHIRVAGLVEEVLFHNPAGPVRDDVVGHFLQPLLVHLTLEL